VGRELLEKPLTELVNLFNEFLSLVFTDHTGLIIRQSVSFTACSVKIQCKFPPLFWKQILQCLKGTNMMGGRSDTDVMKSQVSGCKLQKCVVSKGKSPVRVKSRNLRLSEIPFREA